MVEKILNKAKNPITELLLKYKKEKGIRFFGLFMVVFFGLEVLLLLLLLRVLQLLQG
jgi:hypothetical protein